MAREIQMLDEVISQIPRGVVQIPPCRPYLGVGVDALRLWPEVGRDGVHKCRVGVADTGLAEFLLEVVADDVVKADRAGPCPGSDQRKFVHLGT
jgi:hypothetical protein